MDSGRENVLSKHAIVTLVVEGEHFECSRSLLASSSDYFKKMFNDDYVEAKMDTIDLKNFHGGPEIMKLLIQFLETKELKGVDIYAHLLLLMSSSMLQITGIQNFCEKEICRNLSIENCLDAYRIASLISSKVAQASISMAIWKFLEIVTKETSSFWEQPVEIIEDYLGVHRGLVLGEEGEWAVVEAVVQWIQKNSEERMKYFRQLLNVFDYKQLTINDIGSLLFYDIVDECDTAKNLLLMVQKQKSSHVNNSKKFGTEKAVNNASGELSDDRSCAISSKTNELDNVVKVCVKEIEENCSNISCVNIDIERQANSLLHRATREVPFSPCVVGFKLESCFLSKGNAMDVMSNFVKVFIPVLYIFDVEKRCIRNLTVLEKLRMDSTVCVGFQACAVGPSIYVMGGEYQLGRNQWNNDVWSYDSILQTWKIHESLQNKRRHHLSCSLNDTIYLIGGTGRYRCQLNSVEAYDSHSEQWKKCEPAPLESLLGAAVCAYKDRLLVFTSSHLLTYRPINDSWTAEKLKASHSLGYQTAVCYRDSIYLLGLGRSSNLVFKFSLDGANIVGEPVGYFLHPTVNICAVSNYLYSFTHINGLRDNDKIVEILNLNEKPSSDSNSSSNIIAAEIVWRDGDRDSVFMPNNYLARYSCGCFPLFRI